MPVRTTSANRAGGAKQRGPAEPSPDIERLGVGQLLFRLLYHFREGLLAEGGAQYGYADLREPHIVILAGVTRDGGRLTDLAVKAHLSLATASELVTELEQLGYLERRRDPSDGRAKLIYPTTRGRRLLKHARERVRELEKRWAAQVGGPEFERALQTLQRLLDAVETADNAADDNTTRL